MRAIPTTSRPAPAVMLVLLMLFGLVLDGAERRDGMVARCIGVGVRYPLIVRARRRDGCSPSGKYQYV